MKPVIAIVGAGSMGSAVAGRLTGHGCRVLTVLEGRSAASVGRAQAAGMTSARVEDLGQADFLLSIVPPAVARSVAENLVPVLQDASRRPLYIDCNAVNPATVQGVRAVVEEAGCEFVDAAIIGPPPAEGTRSIFYACGAAAGRFAELGKYGLDIAVLDGPTGAASALKMCFAGMSKGVTAIMTAMILAAERAGASDALRAELAHSRPELLTWCERQVPPMFPKAYRWVAEMQEIAEFAGEDAAARQMYLGIARLYERIAADRQDPQGECEALRTFATDRGRPSKA